MENPLYELYKKRFGEKFTSNLSKSHEFQLDFFGDFVSYSPNKCKECKATKFRQDLPFWIDNIQKNFMVISQDPGKGIGDNFNTVFSIHQVVTDQEKYLSDKKNLKYFNYLNTLIPNNFIHNTFFTDLIKCSFSIDKSISINDCVCKNDILTES